MSNEHEMSVRVVSSCIEVAPEIWNRLADGGDKAYTHPFLDHAFFKALEDSGCATAQTGWLPQHVVIEREGVIIGLMPMFLKLHSKGEYVFDQSWAQAFTHAGGNYYPKLQSSVPFTPAQAPKLWALDDDIQTKSLLLKSAEQICALLNASSVHATFVDEEEEVLAQELGWLTRHDIQYHWHNHGYGTFDDFLTPLRSSKRRLIKRERRESLQDGIGIEWVTGNDLTETHWDAFFEFYMDTSNRKWGQPYLNREFFSLISEAMADRILLIMAKKDGKYIAGALNFVGKDTLFGRNWGAIVDVPFLHFEVCYYQAIDYAITHGLQRVEAGAQGDHKLARGYEPEITRSIHYLEHAGLRHAVADYLAQEQAAIDEERENLRDFTPFHRKHL